MIVKNGLAALPDAWLPDPETEAQAAERRKSEPKAQEPYHGPTVDAVSPDYEIEHATLNQLEFPTEGEWKRALADRKVFEEAYVVKLQEIESPEPGGQFSLSHPLRGQRFVAVPAGAIGVGFIWEIGGTKQ